jgi:hypothetical protein
MSGTFSLCLKPKSVTETLNLCLKPYVCVSATLRYEETPEGQLQAQPPPEGTIFTGERNSRVGPGQYDPTVAGVRPQPKAAVFGRGPEINRTAFLLSSSVAPGTSSPTQVSWSRWSQAANSIGKLWLVPHAMPFNNLPCHN